VEDKLLLRIAIATAFTGLCALFFMMYFTEIPLREINSIDLNDVDNKIIVEGVVEKVAYSTNNKTTFITISQECKITAVSFDMINITDGTHIRVEGKVSEYDGRTEIIVDKITSYNSREKRK